MTTENRRNSKANRNSWWYRMVLRVNMLWINEGLKCRSAQHSSAFQKFSSCAARIKIDITVVHRYALIYARSVKVASCFSWNVLKLKASFFMTVAISKERHNYHYVFQQSFRVVWYYHKGCMKHQRITLQKKPEDNVRKLMLQCSQEFCII